MPDKLRVGVAMCGSFCTYALVLPQIESLCSEFDVTPIMSSTAFQTDSRFGKAEDFIKRLEETCGKKVLSTVAETEPIGPKGLLDVLVVAPATGNTLAKLASGIADGSVTLAVKAHLRNERPVVLAISTNDALGAAAKNIGALLNMKHIYFVPFSQDDPHSKPRSAVADMTKLKDTILLALEGQQIQPIIFGYGSDLSS